MENRICPSCGNVVTNPNARFCNVCGSTLSEVKSDSVTATPVRPVSNAFAAKLPGSTFLLVTGIIMIVFGAIGLIVDLIALIGGIAMGAYYGSYAGIVIAASLFGLTGAAIELMAGIMGCAWKNRRDKARTCLIMGIICASVTLISFIMSLCTGGIVGVGTAFLSLIFGSVLPVLYIIGANRNM